MLDLPLQVDFYLQKLSNHDIHISTMRDAKKFGPSPSLQISEITLSCLEKIYHQWENKQTNRHHNDFLCSPHESAFLDYCLMP